MFDDFNRVSNHINFWTDNLTIVINLEAQVVRTIFVMVDMLLDTSVGKKVGRDISILLDACRRTWDWW